MNHCCNGGTLVGARDHLPTHESDFYPNLLLPLTGCNALLCGACGKRVVSQVGLAFTEALPAYAALRAGTLPLDSAVASGMLARAADQRLYVCDCQGHAVSSPRVVGASLDWDEHRGEEAPPWRCAGHPLVTLPFEADGVVPTVTWDAGSGLAVARAFLRGEVVAVAPYLAPPSHWLVRCEALLAHTVVAAEIAEACVEALAGESLEARVRAVDYYFHRARAEGAARLVELLDARPSWLEAADPFVADQLATASPASGGAATGKAVEDRVQDVVAARFLSGTARPEEVALALSAVGRGLVPNDLMMRGLAAAAPAFVVRELGRIYQRAPGEAMAARLVAAVSGLAEAGVVDAVVGLAAFMPRDTLRAKVTALLFGPARAAVLEHLRRPAVDTAG